MEVHDAPRGHSWRYVRHLERVTCPVAAIAHNGISEADGIQGVAQRGFILALQATR